MIAVAAAAAAATVTAMFCRYREASNLNWK
jgi:hypothetical protein